MSLAEREKAAGQRKMADKSLHAGLCPQPPEPFKAGRKISVAGAGSRR